MGIILLLIVFIWLLIATWPFHRFHKRGDNRSATRIGLPFMLIVLLAPFWDFFFMLPAIYSAYFKYGASEVSRVSDARSILVRSPPIGEFPGVLQKDWSSDFHPRGLFQGRLDFFEAYASLPEDRANPAIPPSLMRFARESMDSEACQTRMRKTGLERQFPGWCITYQVIEEPQAEVIIESGMYWVTPYSWLPSKQFQFEVWRAIDARSGDLVARGVWGFMWDPAACYFFNACRYVIDEGTYITHLMNVRRAVRNAVEGHFKGSE